MREPWIARIEVEPDGFSILGDQHCAITDVVAAVSSRNEIERVIADWLDLVGLRLVCVQLAEPIRLYRQHSGLTEELERMVESTMHDPDGVHFGDFETPSPKLVQ